MVPRARCLAVLAALSLVASTAGAEYILHFVESDYEAPQAMKVPKSHSMGMFVPERLPAGSGVCVGFQNFANNGNKGKVTATLEIFRGGQSIGRGNVAGKLKGNFLVKCLSTNAPLEVGDVVIGDVKMKKFSPLQAGEPFFVAVLLVPDGSVNRQLTTRAPRPWAFTGDRWGRMHDPAAAQ